MKINISVDLENFIEELQDDINYTIKDEVCQEARREVKKQMKSYREALGKEIAKVLEASKGRMVEQAVKAITSGAYDD